METPRRLLEQGFVALHNRAFYDSLKIYSLDPKKLLGKINRDHGKNLNNPEKFNEYSYQIFKKMAELLKDPAKRIEFTEKVGEKIYDGITRERTIRCSGDPDDLHGWSSMLSKIGEYFRDAGYISDFKLDFSGFDAEKWEKEGEGTFIYTMKDPVILESARRLYEEEGFAQHTSSRTIQAGLKSYQIDGKEKGFNPTLFTVNSSPVEESWEIGKMDVRA